MEQHLQLWGPQGGLQYTFLPTESGPSIFEPFAEAWRPHALLLNHAAVGKGSQLAFCTFKTISEPSHTFSWVAETGFLALAWAWTVPLEVWRDVAGLRQNNFRVLLVANRRFLRDVAAGFSSL